MNHLILGLGGTGIRAWQAVHRSLLSRLESSQGLRRAAVDVCLFDTDARALQPEAAGWRALGSVQAPPAAQRLALEAEAPALAALLQARPELRGTVAPDGQGWEARLQQLGAFDAPLSQAGARLPGWPTRRLGRLLLAVHEAGMRGALDAAMQSLKARHGERPLVIHVVAHLGGATGSALLMEVLDLLARHPPAVRTSVQVYLELPDQDSAADRPAPLAEVQAYAVLRELQAAAEAGRFERCYLGAMADERGLQPLDAAARAQRLADWLYLRVTDEPDGLATPRRASAGVTPGEFAAYGLAERGTDRHAVHAHLSHELLLRLLAQLRYNHWRPGLGFVTHPQPAPVEPMADLLAAWGLSDAHLQLAVPLPEIDGDAPAAVPIEQEWQMLEAHYLNLIPLVPAERRLVELRRLFDQGLAERFRGHGIDQAFDQPDHAVRRRAVAVRQRVEGSLWDDWRQGRRALHDCGQLLAAVLADVADRFEPMRQEQRTLEAQAARLSQQLDEREQSAAGRFGSPFSLLRGAARERERERDLHEAAVQLREYAVARTRAAVVTLGLRLLTEIESQLTVLQGMVDAGELAVAALVEETDAAAAAALPAQPAAEGAGRIDTRELLARWRTQLVTRESVQREHLRVLRAGLFAQLGEQARFRIFAQRMGEAPTCDALLAACAQRFPVSALQSVASAAWDAWATRLQHDPDLLSREMASLQTQASTGLGWSPEDAPGAVVVERLRLPAAPRPVSVPQDEEAAALVADEAALSADGDQLVAERPPEVVANVAVAVAAPQLLERFQRALYRPVSVQEWPEGHGALALTRVVRGLPLQALRRVQELHLRHEDYRLQAGRAALWLQPDHTGPLPELLAADVDAQKARARTVVLLAEALGLLREEVDPLSGLPLLQHVRLDEDGFELDRVRLGQGPVDAVEQARERVLHELFDEVSAALLDPARQTAEAHARLRDAMRERIERLRTRSPAAQWDTINRDWNEAARAAMKLVRQDQGR